MAGCPKYMGHRTTEAAVDWWVSPLRTKEAGQQLLLPWLLRVGRITDRSNGSACGSNHGQWPEPSQRPVQWSGKGHAATPRRPVGVVLLESDPDGLELYRTSCIVGHLEVDDGVSPTGDRLWHCRRPGCGAGRFARAAPSAARVSRRTAAVGHNASAAGSCCRRAIPPAVIRLRSSRQVPCGFELAGGAVTARWRSL